MAVFDNAEDAKKYFEGDRYAALTGAKLDDLTGTTSQCSLVLTDDHKNANGGIMGGVIFTLADLAFAALANNLHLPTVAQQVSINYLAMPKGDKLIARGSIVRNGRTTCVLQIEVTDDLGTDVALFTGTGYKLSQK